ncbi:MAG TPA: translation initiation factor IF-2 N-terminal domain-containing protein, partial [Kiritimatiellia bacterium]|nr:translation initiation factor IF-2 N-terminal domain-containing protein [Kiritimatiellia bacterium]
MRICDLAKELMTTGKELLGLLQARGCTARSTQANLTPELEQYLRDEIKRIYYGGGDETPAAAEAAPAGKPAPEPEAAPAADETPAEAEAAPAAEATAAAGETPDETPAAEPAAEAEAPAEAAEPEGPRTIAIKGHVVVKDFADMLGVKPNVLITELMRLNIFASIGMKIEFKVAQKVAEKFGVALEHEKKAPPPPPP